MANVYTGAPEPGTLSIPLPFELDHESDYQSWRSQKLLNYPTRIEELIVPVQEIDGLSLAEIHAIQHRVNKANMAIYEFKHAPEVSKLHIQRLGQQFGLFQLDHNLLADEESISTIRVSKGRKAAYVPYTRKALSWHTDGYYNPMQQKIRAFTIHCLSDAESGGETALLDPELVYISLRDQNPEFVHALMDPGALTIPANEENGAQVRPAQTGPVFSIDTYSKSLHMRYTARNQSIQWKQDALTLAAKSALEKILRTSSQIFSIHLQPGQGIICNNVLHNRSEFTDNSASGKVRIMYRARYYDRVRVKEFKPN